MDRLYFFIAAATFVAVAFAKPESFGFEIGGNLGKFRAEAPKIEFHPQITKLLPVTPLHPVVTPLHPVVTQWQSPVPQWQPPVNQWHPPVTVLQPVDTRMQGADTEVQPVVTRSGKTFHYTFGEKKPGNIQIGYRNNRRTNTIPQDYQIKLKYPAEGVGSVITHVDMTVEQSSDISNVYIISGGIGQKQISIAVEAKGATYLNSKANIYGF